jgi:hypothetical protein
MCEDDGPATQRGERDEARLAVRNRISARVTSVPSNISSASAKSRSCFSRFASRSASFHWNRIVTTACIYTAQSSEGAIGFQPGTARCGAVGVPCYPSRFVAIGRPLTGSARHWPLRALGNVWRARQGSYVLASSEGKARHELEPAGASTSEKRSWRARHDSNLRPLAPEANALSS